MLTIIYISIFLFINLKYISADCTNCLTCNQNVCLKCNSSFFNVYGDCQLTQPINHYCNYEFVCEKCQDINCQECKNSKVTCDKCLPGYYAYEQKCNFKQPMNTYCLNNICTSCNDARGECTICDNTYQCIDPYCNPTEYTYNFKCQTNIPEGAYCDSQRKCVKCSIQNCVLCNKSYDQCDKCLTTLFLYNNVCYSSQPFNTHCENGICTQCTAFKPCQRYCKLNGYECISMCPIGQYELNLKCFNEKPQNAYCDPLLKICTQCSSSCQECLSDINECLSCKQNYFLHNKKCFQQQPTNTYCDQSKICKDCSVVCSGFCDANMKCIVDCPTGQYSYNGQCESQRPPNTYCNNRLQCSSCKSLNCMECQENLQDCLKCQDGFYLKNGICDTTQPINTYCKQNQCQSCADQSNLPCPQYCDSLLQCINNCSSGQYLLIDKCLTNKPSNTYCNPKTKICQQCKSTYCEECEQGLINCIQCKVNTYLYQSECSVIRPINTYCSKFNVCYKCGDQNQSCNFTCDSSLSCIKKCAQNNYFLNGICYISKPQGAYCNNQTLECQTCKQSSWLECDSTLEIATKCKLGQYLYDNSCISQKPVNTFCSKEGICQKCQDSSQCEVACDESLKCIKTPCQFNNYSFNGTCTMNKPFNVGCDLNTLSCQKCENKISNCAVCDDSLKICISCYPDYYMFENNCFQIQPKNTNCGQDKICQSCKDSSNQSCDGYCDSNLACILVDTQDKYILNGIYSEYIPEKSYCDPATKICLPCQKSECQTCDQSLKICTSCPLDSYFFYQDCYNKQPQNTYCSISKVCQICDDKNNNPCNNYCNSNLQCINCKEGEYEYEGNCLSERPQNTYCDDKNLKCQKCQDNSCVTCDSTTNFCLSCQQSYYLFEGICYNEKPSGSFCNLNSKDQITKYQICDKCYKSCKDCTGPSLVECEDCKKQDLSQNPLCYSGTTVVYKSSITPEQIENIQKTVSQTSQSTVIASTTVSLVQGILSSSSCGLLISGLTSQKLAYMILVRTKLPEAVQFPLEVTKGQIPSEQFQIINFLDILFHEKEDENIFYNEKFRSVNLKYSIFATCGQGVSIFLICESLFVLIYLFKEKIKSPKINQFFTFLYSKLLANLIIQYIQLTSSMFSIGISSQILEFVSKDGLTYKTQKIITVVLLQIAICLINYKIYYYLNVEKISETNSFSQITREKAQNETISESKIRRNFIMMLIFSQSIIQPIVFILLNQSYITICVVIIIVQIVYSYLIIYLIPFYSKITNIYFITDSLAWLALYIEFLIINIYSRSENINEYAIQLDNTCWVFVVTVQIILILNPVYLIIVVISKIIDLINQRLPQLQLNSTSNLLFQQQNKFEISDTDFDKLYRQLWNNQITELDSIQVTQTKTDVQNKKQLFDKIRKKIQQKVNDQQFY